MRPHFPEAKSLLEEVSSVAMGPSIFLRQLSEDSVARSTRFSPAFQQSLRQSLELLPLPVMPRVEEYPSMVRYGKTSTV
jgi:hypothetical protein